MTTGGIPERTREWCFRFGNIAVKRGFVTKEQVKQALLEQIDDDLNDRPHRLIGEILFVKDWITWEQMDVVLKELFVKGKNDSLVKSRHPGENRGPGGL
ncbi:MAG: hypothetical protein AB1512_15050 [Thermodesulfobacteriota bacterium]